MLIQFLILNCLCIPWIYHNWKWIFLNMLFWFINVGVWGLYLWMLSTYNFHFVFSLSDIGIRVMITSYNAVWNLYSLLMLWNSLNSHFLEKKVWWNCLSLVPFWRLGLCSFQSSFPLWPLVHLLCLFHDIYFSGLFLSCIYSYCFSVSSVAVIFFIFLISNVVYSPFLFSFFALPVFCNIKEGRFVSCVFCFLKC